MFLYSLIFTSVIFNRYNGGGHNLFIQVYIVEHIYHIQFYSIINHTLVMNTVACKSLTMRGYQAGRPGVSKWRK